METNPDPDIELVKQRWLDIASKEKYPHTPEITEELNRLEQHIHRFRRLLLSESG